ncbi:glucitol operon repressor [Peptococcaceae bacterium CEB3]|nr:glucitol operon repressor [Peptococcaceae bacterium CEB3]
MVNDMVIASYLENYADVNLILVGGAVRRNFHCTVGPTAIRSLEGLNVDKAFMATNGITVKKGLTTPDFNQAEVKKTMIDIASEVTVLSDSSKIRNNGFVQIVPIAAVQRLITDDKITESDLAEFEAAGIEVCVAKL